jgi:RIO-like serine/threonine protein kinase
MGVSTKASFFPAMFWLEQSETGGAGSSFEETDLRVLETLEQLEGEEAVDLLRLSSLVRLPPSDTETAVERLLALDLVREHRADRPTYAINRAALRDLLKAM